jgi:hypothetical protein
LAKIAENCDYNIDPCFQETRVLMGRLPEVVDTVIGCMSRHDNLTKVFSKGCAVLWKLAHEESTVKVSADGFGMTSPPNLKPNLLLIFTAQIAVF